MSNATNYKEVREYKTKDHLIRYYFIARVYSDYVQSICAEIAKREEKPDIFLMNSCCWDLTRYKANII